MALTSKPAGHWGEGVPGPITETQTVAPRGSYADAAPFNGALGLAKLPLGLGDARFAAAQRHAMAARVAQIFGNQQLQRTLERRVQRDDAPEDRAAPNSRPTRSELVTIANSAVNAEYAGAARDGLSDFESDVGTAFDFSPMVTALIGNIIWAAACFQTGGAAFLISLAGIGIGTAAPLTSGTADHASFHQLGAGIIETIRLAALNQVVRVTTDIDQRATAENWDEFRTRRELLLRLLKPEYVSTVAGGLPTVNRAAIAHSVEIELLTRANTYGASFLHWGGGGRFIYDFAVSGHHESHGFWPFDSETITPISRWRFVRGQTQLYIPQGEDAAFRAFTRLTLLQPADMAFEKKVYIHSSGAAGDLEIDLDGSNSLTAAHGYGVLEPFADPPHRPAARSPPPPSNPIGVARAVLAQMWSATGGRPPWVRGQDLQRVRMPGRSRATR